MKRVAPAFQVTPYKGGAQAIADLVGGHVDAHVDVVGNSYHHVKEGRLVPLAVLEDLKLEEFPNAVPQDGRKPNDLVVTSLLILTVNAKTPDSTVQTAYEAIRKVAADPTFREKMQSLHFNMVVANPSETTRERERLSVAFKQMFEISGLPRK